MRLLNPTILLWFAAATIGIPCVQGQPDPPAVLTYAEYIKRVTEYHPAARRAELPLLRAEAERLAARGNFDPVLGADWQQKNFDNKLYYQIYQGELKVPTRLGIDVAGGYENTAGDFLNPENSTDRFGLWRVGLEADLLQGLFVNERNTQLRQADIAFRIADNQRQQLLNEVIYEATAAYLYWQQYTAVQDIILQNIGIARDYFFNTREAYFGGEKTAVDTLEAYLLLQDRNLLLRENSVALTKAVTDLNTFVWDATGRGNLPAGVLPERGALLFPQENLSALTDSLVLQHPKLLEKRNKQVSLNLEERLKREKLKPKLKAKYYPLLATSDEGVSPAFAWTDYKWGFDFSFPLLLRSERAGIQMTQVKIQSVSLDIQNTENQLRNQIENARIRQNILREQIALQEQNTAGYLQLMNAENEKFRYGESSVFLLNKRQEKYIESQIKLINLRTKYQAAVLQYLYYANRLL